MIDLSALDGPARYAGDYRTDLAALEQRVGALGRAAEAHGARAIIVVEGWPPDDRAGVVERIAAGWDPRRLTTRETWRARVAADGRHFLRPFWQLLPPPGEALLLDGSWYGHAFAAAEPARASRILDEINEFEAQIAGDGTLLIKLYVHVARSMRAKRLAERMRDPWQRAVMSVEELSLDAAFDLDAIARRDRILQDTDTRWAPWAAINGNGRKSARIAALTVVANRLDQVLPSAPPEPSAEVAALLRRHPSNPGQASTG